MRIKITLIDGTVIFDENRKDFPLRLGRHAPCEIVISAPGVSGQHVEIFKDESGKFFLRDLGSRNGTHLREERINKVPVEFPCSVTLGKKVFVELIRQEESSPFLEKYTVNQKQARAESLKKRKDLVSRMKQKTESGADHRQIRHTGTILAALEKLQLVHIFWLFFFSVFSYCATDWFFTRGSVADILRESVYVHGQGLVFSLSASFFLSTFYYLIRSGALFKAFFVSIFVAVSIGKIHFDFFYPFIVSESFGLQTWVLSVALIGILSVILISVILRGFWPNARPGYVSLAVTVFTFSVVGLSGEFLWEKKSGGAYADLFKKVEAPNRVLAGVALSPGQFKDEMKRLKLLSQSKK